MKNFIKTGLTVLVFVAILGTGVPVFAQSYGYAQNYTPIVQTISIPQNQLMYIPSNITQYMPSYMVPSYSSYGYTQPSYNYSQPSYNTPSYNTPSYTYPNYGYGSNPTYYDQYNYYPYTNTQKDPNSYPRYWPAHPEYDDSYAWFSNYYQDYPNTYGVYTGNTDLFGTPLCDWSSGYKGYDCSYDPHQWVYDPYTGTWY
jgi:hypothetical protein